MLVNGARPDMGLGMKHLDQASRPVDSRAPSSCESDIDRQELISNYASERYLSKWNLDVEEDGPKIVVDIKVNTRQPSREEQAAEHILSTDNDNASLVSYNSVRDETPTDHESHKADAASNSYLPYQLSQGPHPINVWQGYSGNIYFDPVRCHSMRINCAKPDKSKNRENSHHHRKSKSCSPSIRNCSQQTVNFSPSALSTNSFHNLGSLRIAPGEKKKGKKASPRNPTQFGRIYKGFSENSLMETVHGFYKHVRSESAPEPLMIAGDQVGEGASDPIDKVQKHNSRSRLTFKSKYSDLCGGDSFPSLIIGKQWSLKEKGEQFVRFPGLDCSVASPSDTASSSEKDVTEPKPVLIIPFGAFDDPVESGNNGAEHRKKNLLRRERNGKTKTKLKAGSQLAPGRNEKKGSKRTGELAGEVSEVSVNATSAINGLPDTRKDVEAVNPVDQDKIPESKPAKCEKSESHHYGISGNKFMNTKLHVTPDLNVRRQISNSSLSNYLRTVPNNVTRAVTTSHTAVPKLSYTQRARDFSGIHLMSNNDNKYNTYQDSSMKTPRTSALYGGYLPSSGRKESKVFRAGITSTPDFDEGCEDSLTIRDTIISEVEGKVGKTGDSSTHKMTSPRCGGVRTSYIRKEPFAKLSVDGPTKGTEMSDGSSCKLPVIGRHV